MTTATTYLPGGFGLPETNRQTDQLTLLNHTITYSYDTLYRLTSASYTSGEVYTYTYDPVGNRLQ